MVVVDTMARTTRPGHGWANAAKVSDIVLIDSESGERRFLARGRQIQAPVPIPISVFSPDAAGIFYNEVDEGCKRTRVLKVANPWAN